MLSKLITDADFAGGDPMYLGHVERHAARGVLLSDEKKVALLYAKRLYCYKLPGGGIKKYEPETDALKRELLEETGYSCRIIRKLGFVEEHKLKRNYMQRSTAFLAETVGERQEPHYTSAERRIGLELHWLEFEEAMELMRRALNCTGDYGKQFLLARDLAILEYAYNHMDGAE